MCYTLLFPKGVSIFVSYELKTLNDNECKDFYYLYTQIRYDDPSAIYCSDLKGALGCFNLGWVFFHFIFISKFQKLRWFHIVYRTSFDINCLTLLIDFFTECDPVVFVDFTGKSIVNKSPRRIWIDPTDTQITRSEKGAQYGRFNGITSRISIPFLSGMSITKLMARLRFFTAGTQGPDSQVLFSNCETETVRWNSPEINKDLSPSIAIILNRKLNRLVFLGSTEDRASEQVMMLLPFKVVIFV